MVCIRVDFDISRNAFLKEDSSARIRFQIAQDSVYSLHILFLWLMHELTYYSNCIADIFDVCGLGILASLQVFCIFQSELGYHLV